MTAALDTMDERIEAAEQRVAGAQGVLRDAQQLRTRLAEERRQAQGRLGQGDATAAVDLDRLRTEYLAAHTEVQNAELAVSAARERVTPLQEQRKKIEAREVAAHLGPLLDIRAALADLFEAKLSELAQISRLYRETVKESVRLGGLLNVPMGQQHANRDAHAIAARRLLAVLRSELFPEFQYLQVTPEEPFGKQDAEGTAQLRTRIEQILSTASSVA
jgi:chromosome segregation ATPase